MSAYVEAICVCVCVCVCECVCDRNVSACVSGRGGCFKGVCLHGDHLCVCVCVFVCLCVYGCVFVCRWVV